MKGTLLLGIALVLIGAGILGYRHFSYEFALRRERLGKAGADATFPDLRRCAADIAQFATCAPPSEAEPPVPEI